MPEPLKARVFKNDRTQTNEAYGGRNPHAGAPTVPHKPRLPNLNDVFRELDEAGAAAFELDRDLSPPIDRN